MRLKRGVAAVATLVATSAFAEGDVEYGEYLSSECVACHSVRGDDKGIPSIVGWDPEAFVAVMKSYQLKERLNPTMQVIAGSLDDEQTAALAAYFSTLSPQKN